MSTQTDSRQVKKRQALSRLGQAASSTIEAIIDSIDSQIVLSPTVSTDNTLPRFNGTSGKDLQPSGVVVDDTNNVTGMASNTVTKQITTSSARENISTDNATGANVALTAPATPIIRLTNAALTSIDTIPAGEQGQTITLINATGNIVSVNDNTGATAANRILTGSKAAINLSDEASIILKYDDTESRWMVIGGTGSGSGGGGLDVYYTESFEATATGSFSKGNNAAFLGGGTLQGTLALESVSPISGTKSLKYTQASGSLNDYFASPVIDLDLKQKDNTSGMTFYFEYDGNDDDMRFVVWDVTNSQELSSQVAFVKTANKATRYSLSFYIPASCTQIQWGSQVLVENIGAVLLMDDVEMSTNPFSTASLSSIDSSLRLDTFAGYGSTNTKIARFSNIRDNIGTAILYSQSATLGDSFTALEDGIYNISFSCERDTVSDGIGLSLNSTQLTTNVTSLNVQDRLALAIINTGSARLLVSWQGYLPYGSVIRAHTDGGAVSATSNCHFTISKVGKPTEHILTPSDTFSTDTAPLRYRSSAQVSGLAGLASAQIGDFITFSYASGGNTRTQTTTAPTQTTADMNQNGIQIFTRAYNANSNANNPAAIAIQIGKGLKAYELAVFKSSGKTTNGGFDFHVYAADSSSIGFKQNSYDPKTGILYLDSGLQIGSSNTGANFQFNDGTLQNNAYVVVEAGKTLPLLAVPTPLVAYLKDVKPSGSAGGTFTSGAWQTRTLNTVEGDGSIVSLSGNQFTLGPGKYEIEASTPATNTDTHKAKLRNITDAADSIIGASVSDSAAASVSSNSRVVGTINLTSTKVFELQHQCLTTRATNGFGPANSFGVSEVYSIIKITKLS